MDRVVGVDIGGSGVRAALVDAHGQLGEVWRVRLTDRDLSSVVGAVATLVRELGGADAVGAGVPGFVSDGRVLASPNFPTWRDVAFRDALERALSVPVVVENDANTAAWGAWVRGGRAGDLVLLTLGTGVGGGVVSGGQLLRGAGGTGAELGHVYVGGERRCRCGGVGCLETVCSTVGLLATARESGVEVADGAEVVRLAEQGDPWARGALDGAGRALGRGLVTLVNLFNPDRVAIAGGLSAARPWLEEPAMAWLRSHGIGPSVRRVHLSWEGRADAFAILGAAELVRGATTPRTSPTPANPPISG